MNDDADRERLLDDVLAGDVAADAAEVVARCARDPEFASALKELVQVQQRVAARGAIVREDLATPAPELEDVAERAMRVLLAGRARRRPVWPWLAAVVAAAAIAIAVVMWSQSTPTDGDQVLGTRGFRIEATADGALRFHHALAPDEYFVVTVVDGDRVVFTSDRLRAATWRPTARLLEEWRQGWRLEVEAGAPGSDSPYRQVLEGWQPQR
jgi:hypothetical protein